jgi:hypothetical protein
MRPKERRRAVSPDKARAAAMGCYTGTPPVDHHRCENRREKRTKIKAPGRNHAVCKAKYKVAKEE